MIAWGQLTPTRLSTSAASVGRSPESSAAVPPVETRSVRLTNTVASRASFDVAFAIGVHTITCTVSPDRARLPPMICADAVWTVTPSNDTGGIAR